MQPRNHEPVLTALVAGQNGELQNAFGSDTLFSLFTDVTALMPAVCLLVDEQDRHLWVNRRFCENFGFEPGEVIGKTNADLFAPEEAEIYRTSNQKVLDSGKPLHIREACHRRPDGSLYATGSKFPVRLPDGRKLVGAVLFDVTAQVEARRRTVESEERYRGLFDRSVLPMAAFGLDYRVIEANLAYCETFGYRPSEIRGVHVARLLSPDTVANDAKRWEAVMTGKLRGFRNMLTGVRKDRSLFRGQGMSSAVTGPDGKVAYVNTIVDPLLNAVSPSAVLPTTRFSETEARIVELLSMGGSNAEIGAELHLSRPGLDYHMAKLRKKLDTSPRASAIVARAYSLGLLRPGEWPPTFHQRPTSTAREGDG